MTASRSSPDYRPNAGTRSGKLTPEVYAKLVESYALGCSQRGCAAFAGISLDTLKDWLKLGERDGEQYDLFRALKQDMDDALARSEVALAAIAQKAALTDPRIALKLLAIRWSGQWSEKHRLEVSGADGVSVAMRIYLPELDALPGSEPLLDTPSGIGNGNGKRLLGN